MKQILVVILLIFSVIQSKAQVETNYYAKNEYVIIPKYSFYEKNLCSYLVVDARA